MEPVGVALDDVELKVMDPVDPVIPVPVVVDVDIDVVDEATEDGIIAGAKPIAR